MKHRLCNECYAATGHAAHCVSKGYAGVGPHPDAPPGPDKGAPVRTGPVELCCGGTRNRAGCEYHDPSLQPKPAYEVYDIADIQFTLDGVYIWGTSAPSHWCNSPACPTCQIVT